MVFLKQLCDVFIRYFICSDWISFFLPGSGPDKEVDLTHSQFSTVKLINLIFVSHGVDCTVVVDESLTKTLYIVYEHTDYLWNFIELPKRNS